MTSRDPLEIENHELKKELGDLRELNNAVSGALDEALKSKDELVTALTKVLDVVPYSDFKELEERFETLEHKVENLEYEVETMTDEYDLIDRVTESMSFESAVEDIVKTTLISVVLKMEVN